MAFTYSGPSTAAALTVGVLNDAITIAQGKTDQVDGYLGNALTLAANAPQIIAPTVGGSILLPTPPTIDFDANSLSTLYQSAKNELTAQVADSLSSYLTTYFPLGQEVNYAREWIENQIHNGGSGIDANVEMQIWDRDRSRILNDADRVAEEATATWAARRYPIPPGALTNQVLQVARDAQKAIAESSRAAAIKAFETDIENTRFAIQQAMEYRRTAMATALQFVGLKVLDAARVGAQLGTSLIEAEVNIARALTAMFQAQTAAAELPLRKDTTNAELRQRANEANQRASIDTIKQRVDVVMAAAQALSTQAAALLNGFHASVGVAAREDA